MKKILFCIFLSLSTFFSCTEKYSFKLQGELVGLQSDTLLVSYHEPYYKLDTIVADHGKFEYTPQLDTLTLFSLLVDRETVIPIFAHVGGVVTLSGSKEDFKIVGAEDNERMNFIFTRLHELEGQNDSIKLFAKQFIKENPSSYATLYLLERFFINQENPDEEEISSLIQGLTGKVEDTYYAIMLQTKLGDKKPKRSDVIYNLPGKDKEGTTLDWGTLKKGYTLVYFWASWDSESCSLQDSLVSVHQQLKKENFNLYGYSLDMNREEWLHALPTDTLRWKQVCNFTGWEDELIKQQRITRLPATLLIGPDKRIRAKDIVGDSLVTKVKELIAIDKKREKEQAARKAKERKSKKR
ncbi:MAG: DUF4369 domain-containing protein [Phocaeicola sp.]